jgi:hypothetical protein
LKNELVRLATAISRVTEPLAEVETIACGAFREVDFGARWDAKSNFNSQLVAT